MDMSSNHISVEELRRFFANEYRADSKQKCDALKRESKPNLLLRAKERDLDMTQFKKKQRTPPVKLDIDNPPIESQEDIQNGPPPPKPRAKRAK